MGYPSRFLRLVVSGPLYTTEQFAYGLSLMPIEASPPVPATVPDAVRVAVENFHSIAAATPAKVETIKLNEIGTDGLYTSQQTVLHEYASPYASATATALPPQIALAVTLDTSHRRGLAARGRFYIPAPKVGSVENNGKIPAAGATAIASAALDFVQALNAALPAYRVCIASRGKQLSAPPDATYGAGAFREVKSIRVGRTLDTIRSRRTAITEEYVTTADVAAYADRSDGTFGGDGGGF